jgi:type I restriction enzyme S subunit
MTSGLSAGMPDIAVQPSEWALVRDILHRHVPGCEIWAFGSRAKHTAKPY